jgi:hypothetical protein
VTAAELAELEARYQGDPLVAKLVAEYRELEPRAACPCFDTVMEGRAADGAK